MPQLLGPRPSNASSRRRIGRMLGLSLVTAGIVAGGAVPAPADGGPVSETVGAYDRGSYGKTAYRDDHVRYVSDPDNTYFDAGRGDYPNTSDRYYQEDRNFFTIAKRR